MGAVFSPNKPARFLAFVERRFIQTWLKFLVLVSADYFAGNSRAGERAKVHGRLRGGEVFGARNRRF